MAAAAYQHPARERGITLGIEGIIEGMEIYNPLKSRTFWTIVITVAIGAINAAVPFLSPDLQAVIQGILGVLAIYFHQSTAVNAGATN